MSKATRIVGLIVLGISLLILGALVLFFVLAMNFHHP
jgi:hypothetical protein